MIIPQQLLFNNYALVAVGIAYVGAFSAATIAIVVWVFKTTDSSPISILNGLKTQRNEATIKKDGEE